MFGKKTKGLCLCLFDAYCINTEDTLKQNKTQNRPFIYLNHGYNSTLLFDRIMLENNAFLFLTTEICLLK
jgi:hypothetical protein